MHRFAPTLLALSSAGALAVPTTVSTTSPTGAASFACNGTSPALRFGTPPAGTKGLAIIVWDQGPGRLLGRWTVYDLKPDTTGLPAKLRIGDPLGKQGVNETGTPGYAAPCGARGRHDIYVDTYALNVASLGLPDGAPLQTVHAAIKRHKIQEDKLHVVLNTP